MKPKMIKVPNLWHRAKFINPHVLSSLLSRRGQGTGFSVLRVKLLSEKAWEEGNDSYWFLRQDSLDMKFCHLKKAEIITEAEFSFLLRSFLFFAEVTTWFIKSLPSFSSSLSHLTSRNRLLPRYVYHELEKNPHQWNTVKDTIIETVKCLTESWNCSSSFESLLYSLVPQIF